MILTEIDFIGRLRTGRLMEIDASNVELKRSWDQDNGKKISAFANRPTKDPQWLAIGVCDDGTLAGHDENWVKKTEETISQHINRYQKHPTSCAEKVLD